MLIKFLLKKTVHGIKNLASSNRNIVKYSDADMRIFLAMQNDKTYRALTLRSFNLQQSIESDYSVLINLGITSGPKINAFAHKCTKSMNLLETLAPYEAKYHQPPTTYCVAAKRLAMIYERCENYDAAADVCVHALKRGWYDDGTKASMRGRLAKLIRKGSLNITPDMMEFL